jgi:multidrug resistance efflux pump
MQKRARIAIPIVLLVALLAGGVWWWRGRSAAAAATDLSGSGLIEADEVTVAAEIGGRVQSLAVDEGQAVRAGQVLVRLDPALLETQLAQAQAAVQAADANLALLTAGARAEEIAAAQAAVAQAQAAREGASRAYEHAVQIATNPQDLNTQIVQAEANRDAARQQLNRLKAGSRAEEIAAAQAAVAQAQAGLQATRDRLSAAKTQAESQVRQAAESLVQAQARYAQAKSNWEYANDTGNDPIQPSVTDPRTGKNRPNKLSEGARQNYYAQFVLAEAALRSAEQGVQQAQVAAEAARQAEAAGVQAAEQQLAAAQAGLDKARNGATPQDIAVAQTALDSAQRLVETLKATRANPQQLQAQVDSARAQLDAAEAQLTQAQARLDATRAGARPEQIAVGRAQLAQAQAAQRQAEVQLAKTTITAPRAGVVLSRPIDEGEFAPAGAPLMTIGVLDNVRLTIYIGERDIGRVRLGQSVDVTVDSFPGRTFSGTVTFIAPEAQFTPRNVQTKDERATTVFAVRVMLPNPERALKPGMPADAVIRE